jgi:uncharacterized Rmd1/YagE family protein
MAETGRLGKTRAEITKINGQLFNLRMNVNLVSNVLGKAPPPLLSSILPLISVSL